MKLDFNSIPKFVVNLDRRPDRLEHITNEMKYIGWDWERFPAIDLNSYMGCTKSILEIITIAKERNYPRVMIIEDDACFMPYSKSLLQKIEIQHPNLEFGVFNLAPTLNRPVNLYSETELLLDLTTLPPAAVDARGIYATNIMIYDQSIYDKMFEISLTAFTGSGDYYFAVDDFIFQFIMNRYQSYSPSLPIAPQIHDMSDVSNGIYNNWYLQTYNWNVHSQVKIPNEFVDWSRVQEMKKNKEYKEFYYVS